MTESANRESRPAPSLSILVVDDTLANQKALDRILSERGHRVTTASNGREALEQFAQDSFDVVLLDLEMPVLDGLQTAKAMRELEGDQRGRTPMIALSAHGTDASRQACREHGMDGHLEKPFDVPQLLATVERLADAGPADRAAGEANPGAGRPPTSDRTAPAGPIDLEAMLHRLGGDWELVHEFIGFFEEDAPKLLQTLEAALRDGDGATASRTAHNLKGLASNFGAESVVKQASRLEAMANAGDLAAAQAGFETLAADIEQVSAALRRVRES